MLLLVRGSAKTVSAVLMLLSLWSLPHRSLPDICVPAGLEEHDETKHVFTAAAQGPHSEHCAICHWMRTLKPVFSATPHAGTPLAAGAAVAIRTAPIVNDSALDHLPARAPPSILS